LFCDLKDGLIICEYINNGGVSIKNVVAGGEGSCYERERSVVFYYILKVKSCSGTAFNKGILFFSAGWSLGWLLAWRKKGYILTVRGRGFYLFLILLLQRVILYDLIRLDGLEFSGDDFFRSLERVQWFFRLLNFL
jgi:hypothetical protein